MGKHDMEIRRQKVKRLLAQGASPTEMAERLDCSRSTVYRDIEAIEDEVKELKGGDIDEFLRDLKANFETINRELWTMVYQTEHENVKLGALKEARRTQGDMVDVLQKVGVLEKVADEIQLSGSDGDAIEFVVEEYDPAVSEVPQDDDGLDLPDGGDDE